VVCAVKSGAKSLMRMLMSIAPHECNVQLGGVKPRCGACLKAAILLIMASAGIPLR
jgi:hypothetical protein